jgi:hypothetical protein
VTRWVDEKIAQKVAQYIFCQNECITTIVEKVAPKPGTDVMILKIFSQKKITKKIGVFDSKQS